MAIGDAAGAKGLKVYSASDLVNLGYQQINQRGDEIAAVMTRADKLEQQSIGVPKFSVAKASNSITLTHDTARVLPAASFGTPKKNVGMTWSGGVLTVPRAGVYTVAATMKCEPNDYYAQYIMVTRNSTGTSDSAAVARAVVYPGQRANNQSPMVAPSVSAFRLAAPLNAGDSLRVVAYQRNYGGQSVQLDAGDTSLTFEVLWVDSL